jgi:hypothetical protein
MWKDFEKEFPAALPNGLSGARLNAEHREKPENQYYDFSGISDSSDDEA